MEISECVTAVELEEVWPIMRQLRDRIKLEQYLVRVGDARKEGYRLFAARQDGRAVGLVGFRIVHDLASGRSLYVDDLIVDEGHRGQQVGQFLMACASDAAVRARCDAIRLASAVHRIGAHKFYEAAGF